MLCVNALWIVLWKSIPPNPSPNPSPNPNPNPDPNHTLRGEVVHEAERILRMLFLYHSGGSGTMRGDQFIRLARSVALTLLGDLTPTVTLIITLTLDRASGHECRAGSNPNRSSPESNPEES